MEYLDVNGQSARVAAANIVRAVVAEGRLLVKHGSTDVRNIRNFIGAIREYTGLNILTSYNFEDKVLEVLVRNK